MNPIDPEWEQARLEEKKRKRETRKKKPMKMSGRSVKKLQEIIIRKNKSSRRDGSS